MIRLGNVAVGSIQDSVPEPGSMVSWHPSPVSLAKAQEAPTSAVPASYMQADYLDSFRANAARGREITATTHSLLGHSRAMRYPCHDVRHQRAPSSPRHLPQLVRVHGCRPHCAAHYL